MANNQRPNKNGKRPIPKRSNGNRRSNNQQNNRPLKDNNQNKQAYNPTAYMNKPLEDVQKPKKNLFKNRKPITAEQARKYVYRFFLALIITIIGLIVAVILGIRMMAINNQESKKKDDNYVLTNDSNKAKVTYGTGDNTSKESKKSKSSKKYSLEPTKEELKEREQLFKDIDDGKIKLEPEQYTSTFETLPEDRWDDVVINEDEDNEFTTDTKKFLDKPVTRDMDFKGVSLTGGQFNYIIKNMLGDLMGFGIKGEMTIEPLIEFNISKENRTTYLNHENTIKQYITGLFTQSEWHYHYDKPEFQVHYF